MGTAGTIPSLHDVFRELRLSQRRHRRGASETAKPPRPRLAASIPRVAFPRLPYPPKQGPGLWGNRAEPGPASGVSPRCPRCTSSRRRTRSASPGSPRCRRFVTAMGTLPHLFRCPGSHSHPVSCRPGVLHERFAMPRTPRSLPSRAVSIHKAALNPLVRCRGPVSRDRDPPSRRVPQESFLESSPAWRPRFDRCRGGSIRSGESRGLLWVPCGSRLDSRLPSTTQVPTRCPAFPQNAPLRELQESLSI